MCVCVHAITTVFGSFFLQVLCLQLCSDLSMMLVVKAAMGVLLLNRTGCCCGKKSGGKGERRCVSCTPIRCVAFSTALLHAL